MLRYVPVLLEIALTIYCLIDALTTKDSEIRNLPKFAWVILILLVPIVGDAGWLLAGRPTRASLAAGDQKGSGPGPRRDQDRRPRGPDDDPDFLKDL